MKNAARIVLLALVALPLGVAAGREGSGSRAGLNWDQPLCFLNGGTHAGFGAIRGYVWYGEGGVAKSFDTQAMSYQGMEGFSSTNCIVLKKGTTSHTIKVTVGAAAVPTVGPNPTACEVRLGYKPIQETGNRVPPAGTVIFVVGKGNAGDLHCQFCTAGTYKVNWRDLKKCSATLPAPWP